MLIRIDDRQIRAAGIELARVEPEGGTAQTVLPGTVIVPPQQLLVVAAPAAGLIESVLVGPNETVRAGQPIARLRSTDLLEAQRTYPPGARRPSSSRSSAWSATSRCSASGSSPSGAC